MFISFVLLAAGESSRMGQPKQTLPWEGTTLLQYQVAQVAQTSASELIVVLGHDAEAYRRLVPSQLKGLALKVVVNRDYASGKSGSVKFGVSQVDKRSQGVIVLAADSPRPSAILQRLVDCHAEGQCPITIPSHKGKQGHPPAFARSLYGEIAGISEEHRGLREVIERDPTRVREVEYDTPLVLININSPEDYQRASDFMGSASAIPKSLSR